MNTLQHIPFWVPLVFFALLAWGLAQTRTRQVRPLRLVVVNGVPTVLTLVSVVALWRATPWLLMAVCAWALACALVAGVLGSGVAPAPAHYDATSRRLWVPGSWAPLALYMGIFACKFGVGMLSARTPDLIFHAPAALGISTLYGALSGLLNARAARLLKLQWRH